MRVLGLTGSFGTGKSFVASIFKSLGAKVIDADKIARKALKKGSAAYEEIIDIFGKRVLDKNGNIDRRRLGKIVFDNKRYLKRLNEIVHPVVIKEIKEKIRKSVNERAVVIDAPLLVEANLRGAADNLVVVKASEKNQITRCMKKFDIGKNDVLKRIGAQIPLEKKLKMADYVIDNDGTKAETKKQVGKIWEDLWR